MRIFGLVAIACILSFYATPAKAQPKCSTTVYTSNPGFMIDTQPSTQQFTFANFDNIGSYIGFDGCIVPPFGGTTGLPQYYTGQITNLFLDTKGHFLAVNGQGLINPDGTPLNAQTEHLFGAGAGLGYQADPNKIVSQIVVIADVIPCASANYASCTGLSASYVTGVIGYPVTGAPSELDKPSCGDPTDGDVRAGGDNGGSQEDEIRRLYSEGLMRATTYYPPGKPAFTQITLGVCVRFVPKNPEPQSTDSPLTYTAQGTAVLFNTNGQVLDNNVSASAIGGQQMGTVQYPNAKLLGNRIGVVRSVDGSQTLRDGIGVFGVTFTLPETNIATVDSHVLLSVAVTQQCSGRKTACDGSTRVYYRVFEPCAPDLPRTPRSIANCPALIP